MFDSFGRTTLDGSGAAPGGGSPIHPREAVGEPLAARLVGGDLGREGQGVGGIAAVVRAVPRGAIVRKRISLGSDGVVGVLGEGGWARRRGWGVPWRWYCLRIRVVGILCGSLTTWEDKENFMSAAQ